MSFIPRSSHSIGCHCSVCWAHNFTDALQLMPYTEAERTLYTDYYTFHDYTAEFKRKNHTSDAVERASGRGTRPLGRDLSAT